MITYISIRLKERTIGVYDQNDNLMKWPLSRSGAGYQRYAKSSVGGLLIQALTKAIENAMDNGRPM